MDFTSASAKSNLANVGGILARIKNFFLQRWFLIGSSIRFQAGVTFEEKLHIITEGYHRVHIDIHSAPPRTDGSVQK